MKIRHILLVFILMISSLGSYGKEYHVAITGSDNNDGSAGAPFKTVNRAAQIAVAGDIITVHAGTYREWINPARGGENDSKRIVYQAATGEIVYLKGSELVKGWKKEKGKDGVWKVTLPESFFGNYNPYRDSIWGDWFFGYGRVHHTGEVFLNGKSLYEKEKIEKVFNPQPFEGTKDKTGSTYTWYCESKDGNTTIWANFHKSDPNREVVELSARRTIFYPEKPGINYLTIRGFHICQAATQWAAPTAEQIGMISTNWNKGWIIENNVISDSKCSGITLGKERSTGHNVWLADQSLDGSLHYIEVTFRTLRNGWSKEKIGSHIVRNNEIFNCEQTGMCGSMGAAFCIIENNYIHDIWAKRQFTGAEIAGIKFHAAIDTRIEGNRINDVGRGIWLDWMAQGTRVTRNLLYNNDLEDLFMEVDHGPTIVDNNLFLSEAGVVTQSEGGALIHNIIAGQICMWPEPNRYTPYHLPHSTEVAGLSTILSGDYRCLNNMFLGLGPDDNKRDARYQYGLIGFDKAVWPVWISGNVYFNKAEPYGREVIFYSNGSFKPRMEITAEGRDVYLTLSTDDKAFDVKTDLVSTALLGKAKMPRESFENPDGTRILFDTDYLGKKRTTTQPAPGPFAELAKGVVKIKVW
jgi:hypothetical protein